MRKFLYYILKADGRSAKVQNGVVTYTGTRTPLPQTPSGWQELQIAWERSLVDHGVIRNFSLPFGYVRDGMTILRDALYNQSIEEQLFLLIQTLVVVVVPGVSYNWLYQYLYRGEIDLSAAEDNADMINVPCMEGGLSKLLKAGRGTNSTFPFDLEAINIKLDGIALKQNANYIVAGEVNNEVFLSTHTLPIAFVGTDGTSSGTAFFTQAIEDVGSMASYVNTSTNYFIINNSGVSQNYNMKGKIRYMCVSNSAHLSYRWWLGKPGNSTYIDLYNSLSNPVPGNVYEADIDVNFTLANGESLFLIGRYYGANPSAITMSCDFLGADLDISFESTGPATIVKGYLKSTMYRKLVKEVTGDEANASSLLCAEKDYIVLTSGDAIRGISDAEIQTSLNDFYEDMDATFMAGLSVANGKLELERRQKYYDNSNPIDLGILKDVQYTPATDLICNTYQHGHIKPDIEDINGRYEPNGSSEFKGPISKVVKEYTRVSKYKAGPFEIESIRLNLEGKVTTDDNRDRSVYVINCISHKVINASIIFDAGGFFTIPKVDGEFLMAGQQIQIAGSVLNDQTTNIVSVGELGANYVVSVTGIFVNEASVPVVITVLRGEVVTLNRPAYTVLEGVPNNTIFNLPDLTPKAMFKAHWPWIRSMHYALLLLQKIFWKSSDKNSTLRTELAGVVIDEDEEVKISDMGAPMFLPFYASFATEVPVDIVTILEDTPNRCFKGYDPIRGVEIEGFLISAGFAPNDLKEQEFRLLLSPNNDLSLLV